MRQQPQRDFALWLFCLCEVHPGFAGELAPSIFSVIDD